MPRYALASAALAALLAGAAPPAPAQAPRAPAQSPSAQPLIDDFVAAVNGGPAARADFLARRIAAQPRMPRAEFPTVLETIARTSGGLKVASWTQRGRIRLIVTAANGKTARIDLMPDEADPARLSGIVPVAMPAPYAGPTVTGPVPRAELAAGIDRRVQFAADRDDFSGVVLVMKGDEIIYARAVGEADKAAHIPNAAATRFNIGSMGKQFTAVAIGQLIDVGKLTLDTRLIDVLPDYPNPDAARKITIRQLLTHQAGLGMLFERPGWDWKLRYQTMGELLPLFAKAPLEFEPGSRAAYSNEGFIVLGAVVERVTGQTWYDYVQKNVLDRAGMAATANLTDDPAIPDRAVGYKFGDDDPLGFGVRKANWANLSWRGNACGGQFATAADMIRFLQAVKAGKLFRPETAAAMVTHDPHGLADYAFGFQRVDVPGGRWIVGHDGGGPGSGVNSDAKMIWQTGYAYAVMGNYDAPFAQTLGRDIAAMLAVQE